MGKRRHSCVLCREAAEFGHVLCLQCQDRCTGPRRRCRYCEKQAEHKSCYCRPCHEEFRRHDKLKNTKVARRRPCDPSRPVPPPKPKPDRKKCQNCGNTAKSTSQFCGRCIRNGWIRPKGVKRKRATPKRQPIAKYTPRPQNTYSVRNQIVNSIGFTTYADYLASPLWKSIRNRVLGQTSNCCKCGNPANQVHHSQYTNANLTGATIDFLHSVCRPCHEHAEVSNGRKLKLAEANIRLGIVKPTPNLRKNYWKGPSITTVKKRPITNEAGVTTGRSRETESASDLRLD